MIRKSFRLPIPPLDIKYWLKPIGASSTRKSRRPARSRPGLLGKR